MGPLSRRATLRLPVAAYAGVGVGSVVACTSDQEGLSRPRVSVIDFGAKGDGKTDDSAAFQAALGTGADVLVPAATHHYRLTRTLVTERAGQRLCGEGDKSHLVQHGSQANATILAVTHDHCAALDLRMTPGVTTRALNEGWGVAIVNSKRCTIARCRFDGMRRGGVLLSDAMLCSVRENQFFDSVVRADGDTAQADMGYDILIAGGSSDNMVCDNLCASGCGTGIGCQTVADGASQAGNVIRANVIRDHPCYGIMVYLSGSKGAVEAVVVSGNTIDRISGTVKTPQRTAFYGAGIYIQTANDFLIQGNRLRATNTDRRLALSGSAVPAAIAVSGSGNGVIADNLIRDCRDGIASIQATRSVPAGEGTLIVGNVVSDCDRIGINLADCAAATVCANRVTARGSEASHGILVHRASAAPRMDDFLISDNIVSGFHVGIQIEGRAIARASVTGNTVLDNGGYAIAAAAVVSIVSTNIINGEHGIALLPTARRGWCRDNVLDVRGLALIDDSGSGVTTRDNLLPADSTKVSTGLALRATGGGPTGKKWSLWPGRTAVGDLGLGYEGEERAILAEGPVRLIDGAIALRGRVDRTLAQGEMASFVYLAGQWRETG